MQARTAWSPPVGVLGRLCEEAARRASVLADDLPRLRRAASDQAPAPSLASALESGSTVQVIAEIKRRSPSKGSLDDALSAPDRARLYAAGGAAAISVLTEPDSFGGSNADLEAVRAAVRLPVLKKDFHVDAAQVWEARALGASALLLIVKALGPEGTMRLANVAREADIDALFEVREEAELEWALEAGARVIGVNRRNLETLELEPQVPATLLARIPGDCVAVAESGISDRRHVEEVAVFGADAVLVGSSLTRAADAATSVRALQGVMRRGRRG